MAMAYIKVYYNLLERLKPYSDAEIGRLLRGLLEYASSGIQPDFKGNERFIWPTLQEMVDNDAQAYADKCAQMSQNGSKGGRPKKAKGFSENQMVSEKAKGFHLVEQHVYRPPGASLQSLQKNHYGLLKDGVCIRHSHT